MGTLTDTETISFLDLLEQPKEAAKVLCANWMSAVKNDCGVFVGNRRDYSQGKYGSGYVRLKVALLYPYIYYSLDFDIGTYGSGSPCTEDVENRITVFDGEDGLLKICNDCLDKIEENKNIDYKQKLKLQQMMRKSFDKFLEEAYES